MCNDRCYNFIMIETFKQPSLNGYYFHGIRSREIPSTIESALRRKLDIIHVAENEDDLRVPPGNRFEHLSGKLSDWCSIRVNKQYRLIFKWSEGKATETYLDPHTYK